ncbi:Mycosubtilin synthase subunit A, partial [Durusdinium trenchii]
MSSEFSESTRSDELNSSPQAKGWVALLPQSLCWTLMRYIIAFSIVFLSTAAALWDRDIGVARVYDKLLKAHAALFCIMIVSTGITGLGAMWLWWNASTAHILKASRFLVLNWFEGLFSLGIASSVLSRDSYHFFVWTALRLLGQFAELLLLQGLIQHRFQSIWPALNQPRLASCLPRMLQAEAVLLMVGSIGFCAVCAQSSDLEAEVSKAVVFAIVLEAAWILIPFLFLTWVLLVFITLYSVDRRLQAAERVERQKVGTPSSWPKALRRSRQRALLQGFGMAVTLLSTGTIVGLFAALLVGGRHDEKLITSIVIAQCVNLLLNTVGVFLFSRGYRLMWQSSEPLPYPTICTCTCQPKCFRLPKKWPQDPHWETKTKDLARRGLRLRDLLDFYRMLGKDVMPSYQPDLHTTNDVVRLAIIPMTSTSCSSYAQVVNGAEGVTPRKMVTHTWSNLFRDLLASVVADALDEHTFEPIAELLSDDAGVHVVEELLQAQGSIDETYWICAFAINQHSGICGANPRGDVDPATQLPHPICSCSLPKAFNDTPPLNDAGESIPCEMNKFDDMMAYLSSCDESFAEVVAVDASLELFGRAWCIAELAEGQRMGMAQSLKLRNKAVLLERQRSLENLKVEEMTASRPEDVEAILSKIRADVGYASFNRNLQKLIFDKNIGLVTAWKNADALQQMEELSHVLKWARLSTAVTD